MQKLLYVYRALQKLRHFLGISVQLCCACSSFLSCGGLHLHDVCGPSSPSSSISAISPPAASSPYIFCHTPQFPRKKGDTEQSCGVRAAKFQAGRQIWTRLPLYFPFPLPPSLFGWCTVELRKSFPLSFPYFSLSLPFSAAADAFLFPFPDS